MPANAGYVTLVNCNNVNVQGLDVQGISVASTNNAVVTANRIAYNNIQSPITSPYASALIPDADYGIQMLESQNINLTGNLVSGQDYGIALTDCTNIRVFGNNITNNNYYDLILTQSNNNTVEGNSIISNGFVPGIFFQSYLFGVTIVDLWFTAWMGKTMNHCL